jgi:hypothetical protein
MTDKSSVELEREAEAARAKVADTAESLRNKMTPGQIIDELTGLFSSGDGAVALNNLKAQVRDNPLPLTLVGAGLAWLMLGQGAAASRGGMTDRMSDNDVGRWNERDSSGIYPGVRADQDRESSPGDTLSDAAQSAMSMTGKAVDSASDTISGMKERLGSAGARAREGFATRSEDFGQHVSESAQVLFEREPLILAALGLAAGTAIGAMLPGTALEDEQFGTYGEKLRETGSDILEEGVEEAKAVAAEAYEAVKDEADRQGLKPEGDASVVDKVGEVVKAAAKKTEESVREKAKRQP